MVLEVIGHGPGYATGQATSRATGQATVRYTRPMADSPLTGIAHIGLRVFELARSRAFYDHQGFEFIMGPVGPEPIALLRHPAGIELNLILNGISGDAGNMLMDAVDKHAGYTHVAFEVRDMAQTQEMLRTAGIAVTEGPIDFPGGARALFIRDPDRNVVELNQPAT